MPINMDDVRSLITRDEAETAAGLKKNPKDTGMLEHWPSDNGIASVEVSFPEGSITQSQKRKVKKYVELGIAASDIDAQKEFEDKQLEEEAEAEAEEREKDIPDVYDKREPLTEDEILNLVKKDRDAAVRQQNFIADRMVSAYNAYHAVIDEKFNQPGRSTIVSSDVMDTVEWMMPSIMRVFTAAQDVVIIRPVGGEDVSSAEQHQALINYQFNYKMDGFTRFYTWFKDALIFGIGVVKITWENFYDKKAFFYEEMTEEEFTALSTNRNMVVEEFEEYEKIEITIQKNAEGKDEEGKAVSTVFKNVSGFMKRITYAGPWLENIPVSSFFIEPGARSVHEANFVAYRVKRTMDYLRRMQREGVYHNVDKIIPNAEGDDVEAETPIYDKIEKNYVRDLEGVADTTRSSGREEKWVWECWVKLDIDNDGLLEPLLVTFVDETLLRVEQNPFDHGEPPFETIVPIIDCHKLHGISITDLVIEFQRMKTALYRNVFDNLAFSVNNFFLVRRDSGTDYSALIHLKPGAVIFTDDVKEGIREIQPAALPNYIFNLFEYLDSSKENRTGITKYSAGLDSKSLNHMLALDTKIPMADGTWKVNGDITAGDIIIGSNGKPTTVLQAHPVQLPEKAFKLKFTSGDVIKAGVEHRWRVQVKSKHYKDQNNGKWQYLNTGQIHKLMMDGYHVYIPRVGKIDFPEQELPIDPYIFGYWLGDGNVHTNRFTTMEPEVVEAFRRWASQFYKGTVEPCKQQHSGKAITYNIINTPFRRMLKDMGCLKDSRYEEYATNEKHIPEEYFLGSYESRLALLRGLVDSDGCISKKGEAIFVSTSPRLVNDVVRLVISLGGKPTAMWRNIKTMMIFGVEHKCKPSCHVLIGMKDCPASLPRKAERWRFRESDWVKQKIKSIVEIPIEPMRCLSVSAEDQCYCCGERFTVTANTATGVSAIMTASQQRIELIARLMAETGVKQLFRKIISLNQQFVTEKIVIRLFNKQLEITPDKLDGSFDLMVNVGISAGMKELQQSQMLNLLNILPSLAELGLVQPLHIYNVVSKLLESMGYKDINNFIQNPEVAQQGNATPPTAPDGRESPAKQQPNAGNMFGQLQAEPMSASPKQTSPINTSTLFQV